MWYENTIGARTMTRKNREPCYKIVKEWYDRTINLAFHVPNTMAYRKIDEQGNRERTRMCIDFRQLN